MHFKLIAYITAIVFVASIAFSFYFSQKIVKYNASYQTNQQTMDQLEIKLQSLEAAFLRTSESVSTNSAGLVPIHNVQYIK